MPEGNAEARAVVEPIGDLELRARELQALEPRDLERLRSHLLVQLFVFAVEQLRHLAQLLAVLDLVDANHARCTRQLHNTRQRASAHGCAQHERRRRERHFPDQCRAFEKESQLRGRQAQRRARIVAKMNALVDKTLIDALAGVPSR